MYVAVEVSNRFGPLGEEAGDEGSESQPRGQALLSSSRQVSGGPRGPARFGLNTQGICREKFIKGTAETQCRLKCEERAKELLQHLGDECPRWEDIQWMFESWVGRKNYDRKGWCRKAKPSAGACLLVWSRGTLAAR